MIIAKLSPSDDVMDFIKKNSLQKAFNKIPAFAKNAFLQILQHELEHGISIVQAFGSNDAVLAGQHTFDES